MSQQPNQTPSIAPLSERLARPAPRDPSKPEGIRIDFASDIPLTWLLEELAVLGLVVSNNLNTGFLKATLSPRMRALLDRRIERALNSPEEAERRRMLDAGMEP